MTTGAASEGRRSARPNGERGGDAYAIYLAGVRDAGVVTHLRAGPGPDRGKYRDDITVNIGVPYTGGTDIGNTD